MSRSRSSSNIIFIRIRLRTRAKSARSLNGFDRKSSAPASSPRIRSSGVSSAVTMITGMCAVSSPAFSAAQTANPSMSGIITSSITMSGCSRARHLQRLGAVLGDDHVVIGRRQLGAQEEPVGCHVVHNQHSTRHEAILPLECYSGLLNLAGP